MLFFGTEPEHAPPIKVKLTDLVWFTFDVGTKRSVCQ